MLEVAWSELCLDCSQSGICGELLTFTRASAVFRGREPKRWSGKNLLHSCRETMLDSLSTTVVPVISEWSAPKSVLNAYGTIDRLIMLITGVI